MWNANEDKLHEDNEEENEVASLGDLTLSDGIPLTFVIKFVSNKVYHHKLVREGIIFAPFLIMFVFFATAGRDVENDYYIGRVLRDRVLGNEITHQGSKGERSDREVTKTFEDIAVIDDFYDWLEHVLVPNLWTCSSSSLDAVPIPTQQGQNYLLGALRIRSLRANRHSCSPDDQLFRQKGQPPPPLCPDIPEGELWVPPVLEAVGSTRDCSSIRPNEGVVVTNDFNENSLFVALLPVGTKIQIVETTDRMARIAGPVAGWIPLRNQTTNTTNVYTEKCEVTCINCLGGFSGSAEETSLRFNVSNPLVPYLLRYKEANRLYAWTSCGEIAGGTYILGDMDVYHCGGYHVDIPFNTSCTTVQEVMNVLRGDGWGQLETEPKARFIDEVQSRFASVEYFVYTAQHDSYVSVKLFIEIGPSGVVLPGFQFRTFKMWTYSQNIGQTIYDFFFFVFVLYMLGSFIFDWRSSFKRTGRRLAFFLDDGGAWQILEFANITILLAVFGLRWAWWDVSKKTNKTAFPVLEYPPDLDYLKDLYMSQIYANSLNIVLSFLKILKYCQLNDKLNILTATMGKAKDKVVGVLLLFAWSVFAYAIAGHTLFGGALFGFRNINAAYSTLMRMLLGDFDYEALRRENRFLAGLFFWTYCVLALFLLLNFIIAIISEAFSKTCNDGVKVPFHISVQRFKENMIKTLQPENLIAALRLSLKRKSRGHLLEKALINMEKYQHHMNQELDKCESEGLVIKEKLKSFMGVEVFTLLGDQYIDRLWHQIEDDFYFEQANNPEEIENETTKDLIEAGVNSAIGPSLTEVISMPDLMYDFEESIDDLVQRVLHFKRRQDKRKQ